VGEFTSFFPNFNSGLGGVLSLDVSLRCRAHILLIRVISIDILRKALFFVFFMHAGS
jgi:hypothetical protein